MGQFRIKVKFRDIKKIKHPFSFIIRTTPLSLSPPRTKKDSLRWLFEILTETNSGLVRYIRIAATAAGVSKEKIRAQIWVAPLPFLVKKSFLFFPFKNCFLILLCSKTYVMQLSNIV